MITQDQMRDLIGCTLVDSTDSKVGTIGQIFLDDQTGRPEWATVNTGLFGSSESFVPIGDAEATDGEVRVAYQKDRIKNAPNVDVDAGHLDESEEAELYRYYGLGSKGHDGKTSTDDAMTRSEEQLKAGTETVTAGRARLRKWVETEEQKVTVPVKKEKARLETEPITDANRDDAMSGTDISEDEHEVTLSEERPVVTKETVPVERVRLTKEVETTEETVTEDVRKERISADGDVDGGIAQKGTR